MSHSAHCHVTGGSTDELKSLVRNLQSHNFVNQLDIIIPKKSIDLSSISNLLDEKCSGCLIETNLNGILQFLLTLETTKSPSLSSIKLISLDKDVSHQDTLCISKSTLNLRLSSQTYESTGFKGRLSQFSKGNKNLRQQMYDISIDLDKGLKAQFDSNDKNCTRLFWFAERTSDIVERYFVASENMDGSELDKILGQYAKNCAIKESGPKVVSLGVCKIPDLDLVQGFQDPDWLESTLEWLTYASIGGTQLFPYDKTDSYISSYSSLFESKSEDSLVKISISGVLIGSEFIVSVIKRLIGEAGWFGALVYGVKDCNTSYGMSTRHNFSEDGTNDAVILVSSGEWALWEVGDSGDSH